MELVVATTGEKESGIMEGDLLDAIPHIGIMAKWVEICGDLMSPWKRSASASWQYFPVLHKLWNSEWYLQWKRIVTSGGDETVIQEAYDKILEDGRVLNQLPYIGDTELHTVQTWPHGEQTLRRCLVVRSAEIGLQLPSDYNRVVSTPQGLCRKTFVDLGAEALGLDADQLKALRDPTVTVQPLYDRLLDLSHLSFRDAPYADPIAVEDIK